LLFGHDCGVKQVLNWVARQLVNPINGPTK